MPSWVDPGDTWIHVWPSLVSWPRSAQHWTRLSQDDIGRVGKAHRNTATRRERVGKCRWSYTRMRGDKVRACLNKVVSKAGSNNVRSVVAQEGENGAGISISANTPGLSLHMYNARRTVNRVATSVRFSGILQAGIPCIRRSRGYCGDCPSFQILVFRIERRQQYSYNAQRKKKHWMPSTPSNVVPAVTLSPRAITTLMSCGLSS